MFSKTQLISYLMPFYPTSCHL